jgi:hypothetical protein
MMEVVFATAELLRAAVRTVVKTYDDPKADVNPPCAIVGMPELELEGISSAPTRARYPVAVAVADNKESANKLMKLVPQVAQAIRDLVEDAEISETVQPVVVEVGGTQLPGYLILVEV